ncbi:hypothetical protein A176_002322 [Myxococcus hansupus]|uniref:Uncharacterized protein n=1 Tax=Pseudomyxococcus hansupus TaxID=1297742 RepID=A0A0H4WVQ0_9BACT|nr:hypothetical protein A176_002322 [Myxococcus hansupus]
MDRADALFPLKPDSPVGGSRRPAAGCWPTPVCGSRHPVFEVQHSLENAARRSQHQ